MPSVTTSVTSRSHGRRRVVADGARGADDQAAHRVADQRQPLDLDRPGLGQVAGAGRPGPRRSRAATRPVLARSSTGVQPRSASVSAYVVPTRSRWRSNDDSLSDSPCSSTATRPVASGKADRRASGVERDVAPVTSYGEGHGQPRALAGEAVADDPVHGGVDRPGPGRSPPAAARPRRSARAPRPARQRPQARAQPGVHPGGDAAVDQLGDPRRAPRGAAQGAVHALGPGVVGVADGAHDQLVGDLGEQRRRVEQPGPRGDSHAAIVRDPPRQVNDLPWRAGSP